jgi:PAS domain S-box-containing protein
MTKRFLEIVEGRQLDWLLSSAADAMLIADKAGRIILANPPVLSMFGYASEELIDNLVEILLPEGIRHGHVALRDDYFIHPSPRSMGSGRELFGRRRDGSDFPVEVSLSPLQTAQGVPLVMATIHDITRRKQAEMDLQESEARMRAVFDTAVDAIVTIDEKGIIERFNPAAERLFGYAEAEIAGRNVSALMPPPYRDMHDGYLARYLGTGEKRIIGSGREVVGLRKDGSVFPMDLSVAEMHLGPRRMFTGIVRDITHGKLAEQALRQSQTELRQLTGHLERVMEAERKRIAQEIHDELGGLLTGIKAYVSVYNERAVRSGALPDPLLVDAVALADTGFQAVRRVITDLRPSVLDQLGVWAALEWYAGQIEKRSGLVCTCSIDPAAAALELGPELSTMLFRIVQEALSNVVRHAAASAIAIRAEMRGGMLSVEVRDDGKGIDIDPQAKRESWGLVGMHERARYFGGELIVAGKAGEGSSVLLRLPIKDAESE